MEFKERERPFITQKEGQKDLAQLRLLDEEISRWLYAGHPYRIEQHLEYLEGTLFIFASNLREEAETPVQQNVAKIVIDRIRDIIRKLDERRIIDRDTAWMAEGSRQYAQPREWEKIFGKFFTSVASDFVNTEKATYRSMRPNDGTLDKSGDEDASPILSQLTYFIRSSKALARMHRRLYLHPLKRVPEALYGSNDDTWGTEERVSSLEIRLNKVFQHNTSSLLETTLQFFRPRIPEGHKRITWICVSQLPFSIILKSRV